MISLRPVTIDDSASIAEIYAPFVTDGIISFETEPPGAAEIGRRIDSRGALYPWIAAADPDGAVVGYAYASEFRSRRAYRFTVETSVYVRSDAHRCGTGRRLYRALLATLEAQGFTQAIAAIGLPNVGSVAFHESFGFSPAGVYREVGYKLGGWHDVGLWQRPLAPAANPPAEPLPLAEVGLRDTE